MGSANRLSSLAKRLTCVIAVLLLRTQVAKSLETQVSEFQVKAAFLFNFAKFIEWPAGTFADEQQPFTIGIIENNPFAIILEQTVSQKTVKGKTIVVKRCSSPEDLISCRLLFIGKLGRNHISLLIEKVKDAHILTVGEVDGFIQAGGIINFIIVL